MIRFSNFHYNREPSYFFIFLSQMYYTLTIYHLHGTHWAYGIAIATVNAHVLMNDIAITFARDGLRWTIHGTTGTTHTGVFDMKVHRQAS